jgi:hypothetical protein
LHAPLAKETKFFEQEQKSREFEEELKTTLNFLRRVGHFFYNNTNTTSNYYFRLKGGG